MLRLTCADKAALDITSTACSAESESKTVWGDITRYAITREVISSISPINLQWLPEYCSAKPLAKNDLFINQ